MGKIYAYLLSTVAIVAFISWFYHSAYSDGYEAHRLETESKAAQTIITARKDIATTNDTVKKADKIVEEKVNANKDCAAIMDTDITVCVMRLCK